MSAEFIYIYYVKSRIFLYEAYVMKMINSTMYRLLKSNENHITLVDEGTIETID